MSSQNAKHHCKTCKKTTIIRDDVGNLECESCGTVQDFENFQSHFNGINDSMGTYCRIGAPSHKGDFDNKEYKIYKATQNIEDFTEKLDFSSTTTRKVKEMIAKITDGNFGDGMWFPVFIGACCYVVSCQNNMPYSMSEIAGKIGCDLYELGRMIKRVVSFLDLNLPELDIIKYFEKLLWKFGEQVEKEKKEKMLKQGRFLLNCSVKWFLTTGRQPVPLVVAVLVLVSELNRVDVSIDEVAGEMNTGVGTCRKRYIELLETLVKVAPSFSLLANANVNMKNIVKYAPILILYMESRLMFDKGKKKDGAIGFNVEEIMRECLQNDFDYNEADADNSHYFNHSGSRGIGMDSDIGKLSQECLSNLYTQFLSGNEFIKSVDEGGADHRKRRNKDHSFKVCDKLLFGESDLSKKLSLREILEKNVGFDALPPSFEAGELACKMRRMKINAAKQRIAKIMQPPQFVTNGKKDMTLVKCSQVTNKRKRIERTSNFDWEDNIIEILLLHQVKEEEVEQGHYKRMLDLYVFNAETTSKIFGNGR